MRLRWFYGGMILICFGISCKTYEPPVPTAEQRVVIIGIDGLGSYALRDAEGRSTDHAPYLNKLRKSAAWTLDARSVLPSSSAVNWMSLLSGTPPELHGYTEWDSDKPEIQPVEVGRSSGMYPTIFGLMKEQYPKEKTGAIFTWGGIEYLVECDMLDVCAYYDNDASTLQRAEEYILNDNPKFTFVHLDEIDAAGHADGFESKAYFDKVTQTDQLVESFIASMERSGTLTNTIIIITADHGGVNKGHGGKSLQEMQIPWIAIGAGIKPQEITKPVIQYDTGATAAKLLNLTLGDGWRGNPVQIQTK